MTGFGSLYWVLGISHIFSQEITLGVIGLSGKPYHLARPKSAILTQPLSVISRLDTLGQRDIKVVQISKKFSDSKGIFFFGLLFCYQQVGHLRKRQDNAQLLKISVSPWDLDGQWKRSEDSAARGTLASWCTSPAIQIRKLNIDHDDSLHLQLRFENWTMIMMIHLTCDSEKGLCMLSRRHARSWAESDCHNISWG